MKPKSIVIIFFYCLKTLVFDVNIVRRDEIVGLLYSEIIQPKVIEFMLLYFLFCAGAVSTIAFSSEA